MHAESAYLFRHALLRDAAYQLMPPQTRSRLHRLALELLELVLGCTPGRDLDWTGPARPADAMAHELARHAAAADEATACRWYFHRAAEHAERVWRNDLALTLWQELAARSDSPDRARCARRAAELHIADGNLGPARSLVEAALAECADGSELMARLLDSQGRICRIEGQHDQAAGCHGRALEIYAALGDDKAVAACRANLASLLHQAGRPEAAMDLLQQSADTFARLGETRLHALARGNLAALHNEAGRAEHAESMLLEAIACLRDPVDRPLQAALLGNLAVVYAHSSRPELALATYRRVLAVHREVGNRRFEAVVLGNIAVRLREAGKLAEAAEQFEAALRLLRDTGNRAHEAVHSCGYAACLVGLGQTARARELWQQGAKELRELGDEAGLASARAEMHRACQHADAEAWDEFGP